MAIPFAKEVVEFLDLFGVLLVPAPSYDEARVLTYMKSIVSDEPKSIQ